MMNRATTVVAEKRKNLASAPASPNPEHADTEQNESHATNNEPAQQLG